MNLHGKLKYNRGKHFKLLVVAAVSGTIGALLLSLSFAATADIRLYVKPTTQTITAGNGFAVQIRLADPAATNIGYAKAVVKYPAANLAVSSISVAGSDFPNDIKLTYDNVAGTLNVARDGKVYNSHTTDFLLATVTFVAKGAGTAAVTFSGQSEASTTRTNSSLLTATNPGTYTIKTATTPTPPPTPSPTPPPITTPDPSADDGTDQGSDSADGSTDTTDYTDSTDPYSDTFDETDSTSVDDGSLNGDDTNQVAAGASVFNITGIKASAISTHSAKLSWKLSRAAATTIVYGYSKQSLARSIIVPKSTTSQTTTLAGLAAGKTVYYELTAQNAQQSGSFKTAKASPWLLVAAIGGGIITLLLIAAGIRLLLRKRRKLSIVTAPNPTEPPPAANQRLTPGTAPTGSQAILFPNPILSKVTAAKTPVPATTVPVGPTVAVASPPQPAVAQPSPPVILSQPIAPQATPSAIPLSNSNMQPKVIDETTAVDEMDMFAVGNKRLQDEGLAGPPKTQ